MINFNGKTYPHLSCRFGVLILFLLQWFPTWGRDPKGVAEKLCAGRDNPTF